MYIELGDLINIISSDVTVYKNAIFFVKYIDEKKIILTNIGSDQELIFIIVDNVLQDLSIEKFVILKKHYNKGFSSQNGLLIDTWIDIHFKSDIPFIITGKITNHEEDMIEINVYDSIQKTLTEEFIYIDFEYKGIPDNLFIDKFVIRDQPDHENHDIYDDSDDLDYANNIQHQIIKIDEIVKSNAPMESVTVTQIKQFKNKKISLSSQINDLLEDALSLHAYPSKTYMHSVFLLIKRFKELTDAYVTNDNTYSSYTSEFHNLPWVFPVVSNKRHLFIDDVDLSEVIAHNYQKYQTEYIASVNALYTHSTVDDKLLSLQNLVKNFYTLSDSEVHSQNLKTFVPDTDIEVIIDNKLDSPDTIDSYSVSYDKPSNSFVVTTTKFNTFKAIKTSDKLHLNSFIFLPFSCVLYNYSKSLGCTLFHKTYINLNNSLYFNKIFNSTFRKVTIDPESKPDFSNIFIYPTHMLNSSDYFQDYLSNIRPDINVFIDVLLKNLPYNKLSVYTVLSKLNLFGLTNHDFNVKHVQYINTLLENKVLEYQKHIINVKNQPETIDKELNEISFLKLFSSNITNYLLPPCNSSSELISNLMYYDNLATFSFSVLQSGIDLLDVSKFNINSQNYVDKLFNSTGINIKSNKCKRYVLSKQYHSLVQVQNDNNNKNVFFDKELDPTNYNILNSSIIHDKELSINELINTFKYDQVSALHEYDSIINKKRLVRPGDFALLYDKPDFIFFVRSKQNTWEITQEFNGMSGPNIFCNIQKDCFKLQSNVCSNKNTKNKDTQLHLTRDLLSQSKTNTVINKDKFRDFISHHFSDASDRLNKKMKVLYNEHDYSNKLRYNIGLSYIPQEIEVSPYYNIAQLIFNIGDLSIKYEYIILFCNKHTRNYNSNVDESPFWKYCTISNQKLVPRFLYDLAVSYIVNNNYLQVISRICKTQGIVSENGDEIVDMHSGFAIKQLDLHDEVLSYNPIEAANISTVNNQKFNSLQFDVSQYILNDIINITNNMKKNMHITLPDESFEFIIKNVVKDFNKLKKTGFKVKKFQDAPEQLKTQVQTFNIMYLTLSYILIEITTAIPNITTTSTFPGCIKSFHGWPVSDKSNNSNSTYIACVALKTAMKTLPWGVLLSRKLHKVQNQVSIQVVSDMIEDFVQIHCINKSVVQQKINNKLKYIKTKAHDSSHKSTQTLLNFLPPRHDIDVTYKISNTYTNLSYSQLLVKSFFMTTLFYSLLQKHIKELVLTTNDLTLEPSIDSNLNVYDSFSIPSMESSIRELHHIYSFLKNKQHTTYISLNSQLFVKTHYNSIYSNFMSDIRNLYLFIQKQYNSGTLKDQIYITFPHLPPNIKFLNLNSFDDAISNEKDILKSIHVVKELQSQQVRSYFSEFGLDITSKTFLDLFNFVNNSRTYHFDINESPSQYFLLHSLLNDNDYELEDFNDIKHSLLSALNNVLTNNNFSDFKILKDSLVKKISEYNDKLTSFIFENATITHRDKKKLVVFMKALFTRSLDVDSVWNNIRNTHYEINIFSSIENESNVRNVTYIKNVIQFIFNVFPNLVENNVTYDYVNIPKHWDLSDTHTSDISKQVKQFYSFLSKYADCSTYITKLTHILSPAKDYLLHIINILTPSNDNELDTEFVHIFLDYILQLYLQLLINSIDFEEPKQVICIADYISDLFSIFGEDRSFKYINYSFEQIYTIVNRVKEDETKSITDMLKNLNDEERRVDNEFKKYGLGFWSTGKDKGVREHDNDQYDTDRKAEYLDKDGFILQLRNDLYNDDIDDLEPFDMNDIPDDDNDDDEN